MEKKTKIRIGYFFLLLLIFAGLFLAAKNTTLSCEDGRNEIDEMIDEANYCTVDEDCDIVGFGCPFGCGSYVNKNKDVQPIRDAVSKYRENCGMCVYKCMAPSEPVCSNNKCVGLNG